MHNYLFLLSLFLPFLASAQSNNTGYVVEGTPTSYGSFQPPERQLYPLFFDSRGFEASADTNNLLSSQSRSSTQNFLQSELERIDLGIFRNVIDLTDTTKHKAGGAVMFRLPRSLVANDAEEKAFDWLKISKRFQFFIGLSNDGENVYSFKHNDGFVDYIGPRGNVNFLQIIRPRNYLSSAFDWTETLKDLIHLEQYLHPEITSHDLKDSQFAKSLLQIQTGFLNLSNFIGSIILEKAKKFPEYKKSLEEVMLTEVSLQMALNSDLEKMKGAKLAVVRDLLALLVRESNFKTDLARIQVVTDMEPTNPRTDQKIVLVTRELKSEWRNFTSPIKSCRKATRTRKK